jgi:hypothetical protein
MSLAVLVPATSTRLTTVAAVLARLPTADVALVDALIEGASAAIVQHTHRVWGVETVAETLPGSGSRYLGLSRAPVLSVGTVTEDAGTITDYSVADAAAASLYRFDGWGRSGSRMWETLSYSSGYLLPGSGDLRYVVSYTAGYVLPGGTVTRDPARGRATGGHRDGQGVVSAHESGRDDHPQAGGGRERELRAGRHDGAAHLAAGGRGAPAAVGAPAV